MRAGDRAVANSTLTAHARVGEHRAMQRTKTHLALVALVALATTTVGCKKDSDSTPPEDTAAPSDDGATPPADDAAADGGETPAEDGEEPAKEGGW